MNILFEFFLFFYVGFLIYLFFGLRKVKKQKNRLKNLKVSLIIPFNNEARNLKRLINSIKSQSYDTNLYEVIFVNDNSIDESVQIISDELKNNSNFRLLHLNPTKQNVSAKKQAIELGINNSTYDIIVTTDADCWHDNDWIRAMADCFEENTGFVAGLIKYENTSTLFHKLQKLEFASLVSIGASFIGNNFPVLANGATCAYRKSLFFEVGGFRDNLNLASGDEEFLMQKIFFQTKNKIRFCNTTNSFTYTEPNNNLHQFINQRKRWSSKVLFYKNKEVVYILSLIYLFYFALIISIFLSIFDYSYFRFAYLSFIIKLVFDFLFLSYGLKFLKIKGILIYLPLAELLHLPYIFLTPIFGTFGKFNWKGRSYKR